MFSICAWKRYMLKWSPFGLPAAPVGTPPVVVISSTLTRRANGWDSSVGSMSLDAVLFTSTVPLSLPPVCVSVFSGSPIMVIRLAPTKVVIGADSHASFPAAVFVLDSPWPSFLFTFAEGDTLFWPFLFACLLLLVFSTLLCDSAEGVLFSLPLSDVLVELFVVFVGLFLVVFVAFLLMKPSEKVVIIEALFTKRFIICNLHT